MIFNSSALIAYIHERTKITVIDIQDNVSWERRDWDLVDEEIYYNQSDAEVNGKAEAEAVGVTYHAFESRYACSN